MAVALVAPPSGDRAGPLAAEPGLRAGGVVLRAAASPRSCGGGDAAPAAVPESLEVLLVSRRRSPGSFTVPAGKYEEATDGGSFEACALRETLEEAGVDCEIMLDLGWYSSVSKDGSKRRTRFFAMRLLQESSAWTEGAERRRSWRPLCEAQQLVLHSPILVELFEEVARMVVELNRAVAGKAVAVARGRILSHSVSAASMSSDDSDAVASSTATAPARSAQAPGPPEREEPRAELPNKGPAKPMEMTEADMDLLGLPETEEGPLPGSPKQSGASCSGAPSRKVSMEDLSKVCIQDMDGERFCFYQNQVGGHFCLVKPAPESKHISVMRDGPGGSAPSKIQVEIGAQHVVLKPLDIEEHNFYRNILAEFSAFGAYAPQWFGTKTLSHRQVSAMTAALGQQRVDEGFLGERMRSHQFQQYIVLQDLASSMGRPRILDLKMGFKQRSKRHSARKRERCQAKAKSSTSHAIGFRICGIHTEEQSFDKYWGRTLPLEEMRGTLAKFFLHVKATDEERARLVTSLLERLRGLHETASCMLGWRFWNTSLLFIHDAAAPGREADCRLIDFAHCTRVRGATPDEEFLVSVRNLGVYLEAVRDGHPYDSWITERLTPHPSGGAVQDAEELESEAAEARAAGVP